jgi:hypothetical protein
MYLLYLDVSGTDRPTDVGSKHYVLVGLCMHERLWFGLDRRVQELKDAYRYPGSDPGDFELHVRQFNCTIKEQDEIPDFEKLSRTERRGAVLAIRKAKVDSEATAEGKRERKERYKRTDPFIHLSRKERSQLLEDAVDLIASHEGLRFFGEAISKAHPFVRGGQVNCVHQSFTQVIPRFDKYLKQKAGGQRWTTRRRLEHGLLIFDQDAKTETTFEQLFQGIRRHGHYFGNMDGVIEVPFFASSAKVGGLQVVDVCAYVVRRYLDTGAKQDSHEERKFLKLFQRFDRDPYGRLHGLRHYTLQGMCSCLICQQKGHSAPPHPPTF